MNENVDIICRERAELQCALDAAAEMYDLANGGGGESLRGDAALQIAVAKKYLSDYIYRLNILMDALVEMEIENAEKWQLHLFSRKNS